MKRLIFVSQSRLCQNLLALIAKSFPKKIDLITLTDLDEFNTLPSTKPINTIIFDEHTLDKVCPPVFLKPRFKQATKIFIHGSNTKIDKEKLSRLGLVQTKVKPFLPEEIVRLMIS